MRFDLILVVGLTVFYCGNSDEMIVVYAAACGTCQCMPLHPPGSVWKQLVSLFYNPYATHARPSVVKFDSQAPLPITYAALTYNNKRDAAGHACLTILQSHPFSHG